MLIRIDDFPCGIDRLGRPESDHARFELIFAELETRALPYTLGVVPAHCSEADLAFLSARKGCTIALHGWDHAAPQWRRGERPRNEFHGLDVLGVVERLNKGLDVLRQFSPRMLIPTFNYIDAPLLTAVARIPQITAIATDRVAALTPRLREMLDASGLTCWVPQTKFYGRAHSIIPHMDDFGEDDHVALHLTWEAHDHQAASATGPAWALPTLLDRLLRVAPSC